MTNENDTGEIGVPVETSMKRTRRTREEVAAESKAKLERITRQLVFEKHPHLKKAEKAIQTLREWGETQLAEGGRPRESWEIQVDDLAYIFEGRVSELAPKD